MLWSSIRKGLLPTRLPSLILCIIRLQKSVGGLEVYFQIKFFLLPYIYTQAVSRVFQGILQSPGQDHISVHCSLAKVLWEGGDFLHDIYPFSAIDGNNSTQRAQYMSFRVMWGCRRALRIPTFCSSGFRLSIFHIFFFNVCYISA